jgi:PAS domain S-box-containing protein
MIDLFSSNFDYCLYFCGVSFILLATLTFPLARMKGNRLRWQYLAAFCIIYALAVWLELFSVGFVDSAALAALRTAMFAAGFFLLLEFGRTGTAALTGRAPGIWFVILFTVLACVGGMRGVEGLNASVRWIMGVPGALWAASVIWRLRKSHPNNGMPLAAAAAATAACGLALGAAALPPALLRASLTGDASLVLALRCVSYLAQGALACAVAMLFWRYSRDSNLLLSVAARHERSIRETFLISLFVVVIIAGWLFVRREGVLAELDQRQNLVNLARTGVAAVDGKRAARLAGTKADLANPDYLLLKEQMTRMKKAADGVRFYYLMRMVNGTAIFLVDSELAGSEGYSPPGQVYYELAPAHRAVFETRKAAITGPETDRWGTWVSVLAPLDPNGAGTNDLLGIDIDAAKWKQGIAHERADAITIVILLSCLLFLFYAVYRRGREEREMIELLADEESLLLNAITTQVWYLSDPETYGLVNDAHAAFYGHTSPAMSHHRLADVMPAELAGPRVENNREVFASRKPAQFELWVSDGRGEERLLSVIKTPKLDARGEVEYAVCSAVDITDRKKAEMELAKSDEEKAVLLRELQHRVKNSLGMIVGLVDLEAHRAASTDVQQALNQVRDRVMSLSNLYDLLYRAEDVREVRLDHYLRQMCGSLIETYSSGTGQITLRMDLEEVRLQVKSAIPIGLIVNELLTNSLKYAFPGGGSGTVSVGLHAGTGVLSLTVTDDGVGLPADFEERRSKGMGSMLIGMMVRQLKGSYTIEREKGALFRFTIPL